jgi:hypothetical protein
MRNVEAFVAAVLAFDTLVSVSAGGVGAIPIDTTFNYAPAVDRRDPEASPNWWGDIEKDAKHVGGEIVKDGGKVVKWAQTPTGQKVIQAGVGVAADLLRRAPAEFLNGLDHAVNGVHNDYAVHGELKDVKKIVDHKHKEGEKDGKKNDKKEGKHEAHHGKEGVKPVDKVPVHPIDIGDHVHPIDEHRIDPIKFHEGVIAQRDPISIGGIEHSIGGAVHKVEHEAKKVGEGAVHEGGRIIHGIEGEVKKLKAYAKSAKGKKTIHEILTALKAGKKVVELVRKYGPVAEEVAADTGEAAAIVAA